MDSTLLNSISLIQVLQAVGSENIRSGQKTCREESGNTDRRYKFYHLYTSTLPNLYFLYNFIIKQNKESVIAGFSES